MGVDVGSGGCDAGVKAPRGEPRRSWGAHYVRRAKTMCLMGATTTTPRLSSLSFSLCSILTSYRTPPSFPPTNSKMAAASSSPSSNSIYAQVDNYPWDTDVEFQSGLGAILGSTASPEQAVELALRARCFYYSRYAIRSVPSLPRTLPRHHYIYIPCNASCSYKED